jgi:hypothetical protein
MAHMDEGIPGYIPTELGEIPDEIIKIESIGEAYHDFTGSRSNSTVKLAIQRFFNRTRGQSEEVTSQLIDNAFNGVGDITKANLSLDAISKVYSNPEELAQALFCANDNVNPLLFRIPRENLETGIFDELLERLAGIMHTKYELRLSSRDLGVEDTALCVTHDSYNTDGRRANPFNANIFTSASTLFDPAVEGSSKEGIILAQDNGHFQFEDDDNLVEGRSFWGSYIIRTRRDGRGRYAGATIDLILNTINTSSPLQNIYIEYPGSLLRGPSVEVLCMIYERIIKTIIPLSHRQTDFNLEKRKLIGDIRIKNNSEISYNETFYNFILNECIRLYGINPDFLLIFIFFLKELGDMCQHKVAIKFRHLALGSRDELSTIAFLKRGGPISYMPRIENKLRYLEFRVAGTLHKTSGMTQEQLDAQKAAIQREQETRIAKAQEFERISRLLLLRNKEKRAEAKLIAEAIADAIAKEKHEKKLLDISQRALRASGRGSRFRKQGGGSKKRKTLKKQKGGYSVNISDIQNIIQSLIEGLFNNLNAVLLDNTLDTSLFKIRCVNDGVPNIDYTLIGELDSSNVVLLNNKLLGLPLCSIVYMLIGVLIGDEYSDGVSSIEDAVIIIKQFLEVFNFTDSDIERIMNGSSTRVTEAEVPIEEDTSESLGIRKILTEDDKDELRMLEYDIPGIDRPLKYKMNANAYATNTENAITYAKTNLFMKHKNPAVKPRPFLRRSAYSKTRPLYNKNTSQYFQSMTGLTPRGIHVARKTRKRKNSTFKK